jgi:hypothetical protein
MAESEFDPDNTYPTAEDTIFELQTLLRQALSFEGDRRTLAKVDLAARKALLEYLKKQGPEGRAVARQFALTSNRLNQLKRMRG